MGVLRLHKGMAGWRADCSRASKLAAAMGATVLLAACQQGGKAAVKQPLQVEAIVAELQDYRASAVLVGEIQAQLSSSLAFQVNGQVTERLVDVGDRVMAGQVLARINPAEQDADLQAATAALAVAQSQLAQSQLTFERQESLLRQGYTTRAVYDSAAEALETSRSGADSAEAALDSAEETLGQTQLRAFADGVVTQQSVEVGQVVQAGQTAFVVANDGPREAVFDVNEGVLTPTFNTQDFEVLLLGTADVKTTATLREISPTVDQATGSVRVTLAVDTPPAAMTLGSVVNTTVTYQSSQSIILPASALTSDQGQPAVWVVAPQTNVVSRRTIALSAFDSGTVIVASGIEPGETIVTAGANLLYPQQIVAIKE